MKSTEVKIERKWNLKLLSKYKTQIVDAAVILKQREQRSLERKKDANENAMQMTRSPKRLVKKKRATSKKTAIASIVRTMFYRNEFHEIVEKLGKFIFELNVTATHLIVGELKRTLNLLKAIGKGCWILKPEWVFKSFQAKRWLPDEDFELTEFSPAVQVC